MGSFVCLFLFSQRDDCDLDKTLPLQFYKQSLLLRKYCKSSHNVWKHFDRKRRNADALQNLIFLGKAGY